MIQKKILSKRLLLIALTSLLGFHCFAFESVQQQGKIKSLSGLKPTQDQLIPLIEQFFNHIFKDHYAPDKTLASQIEFDTIIQESSSTWKITGDLNATDPEFGGEIIESYSFTCSVSGTESTVNGRVKDITIKKCDYETFDRENEDDGNGNSFGEEESFYP